MYSPSQGEDRQQLLDEIHELKYQNELLKLEKEIATVESQLSKSSISSSTPKPTRDEASYQPRKRLLPTIPPGRPDGGSIYEDGIPMTEPTPRPDQFVTYRKRQLPTPPSKTGTIMKPATYDGTGAWADYKAHFEACAKLNGWSEEARGCISQYPCGVKHRVCLVIWKMVPLIIMSWLAPWKKGSHLQTKPSFTVFSSVNVDRKRQIRCRGWDKMLGA